MEGGLLNLRRAILHVDGDSFFAGCEVARDPSLRGKAVIVGKERGMATALTYEAKALGLKRGMLVSEILKRCPDAVVLPSDYETYSLYSKRMYDIVRRYALVVEEYSIDECFADLTGAEFRLKTSYETLARSIKSDLDGELGTTFSVGLAPTKVLAKVASKWHKPSGLTVITESLSTSYLKDTPVGGLWGIGPRTESLLVSCGVRTAYDLYSKPFWWVRSRLSKPYQEIWMELHSRLVYEVVEGSRSVYKSVSKTRTFTPPSMDREFVFSQLSKNIENACIKLRRHNLFGKKVFMYLKTQDFKYRGTDVVLKEFTNDPISVLETACVVFSDIFKPNIQYRGTGVVFSELEGNISHQQGLFEKTGRLEDMKKVYGEVDKLSKKYGKHTIFIGTSFQAMNSRTHRKDRDGKTQRQGSLLKGETARKRLGIPMLGDVF
jgi:DNA polymerase IV